MELYNLIAEKGILIVIAGIFLLTYVRNESKVEPTLDELRHEMKESREEKKMLIKALEQNTEAFKGFARVIEQIDEERKAQSSALENTMKVLQVTTLDTKDIKDHIGDITLLANKTLTEAARANAKMELVLDELHVNKPKIEKTYLAKKGDDVDG